MSKKTKTQALQHHADAVYGAGFYRIEYTAFEGFTAVSQDPDVPPHSQFLGESSARAHAHLDKMSRHKRWA